MDLAEKQGEVPLVAINREQRLNADLASILDENPYLPTAEDDYAILRLTQMGCDIPGS